LALDFIAASAKSIDLGSDRTNTSPAIPSGVAGLPSSGRAFRPGGHAERNLLFLCFWRRPFLISANAQPAWIAAA
jgi:hypothetical protein